MALIRAFKAIRPVRDKVHLVATRPYYAYKKSVLKAKLRTNPYTFLHIINPEFRYVDKSKISLEERYRLVSEAYTDFINKGILIQDIKPHIYLYRQTSGEHSYLGVVAAASVDEYNKDKIKKHEDTLTEREEMFTSYLDIVGYNAEPVLLSYPGNPELREVLEEFSLAKPEYEYTTTDELKHELWILDVQQSEMVSSLFEKIPALYIADGHHRTASSASVSDLREKKGHEHFPNEKYFLSYILDESQLNILEFNRLIKRLSISTEELLLKLDERFEVSPLNFAKKPEKHNQFTMCIDGDWFLLSVRAEFIDQEHPVRSLDADILSKFVLEPILNIKDLKTDENIDFVSGLVELDKLESKIKKGKYRLAFCLYPVGMDEVRRVADNQMIMPPKSTWIEPKLRSGLTIYNINE